MVRKTGAAMNWKILIRDIAIIYGLTFLGGFVIGVAVDPESEGWVTGVLVSNIVFSILGFSIVVWLTQHDRFIHLVQVVVGLWILSFSNRWFGVSVSMWVLSIIPSFCFMLFALGITVVLEWVSGRRRAVPETT